MIVPLFLKNYWISLYDEIVLQICNSKDSQRLNLTICLSFDAKSCRNYNTLVLKIEIFYPNLLNMCVIIVTGYPTISIHTDYRSPIIGNSNIVQLSITQIYESRSCTQLVCFITEGLEHCDTWTSCSRAGTSFDLVVLNLNDALYIQVLRVDV